jgi:translation initiation factor IF-1
MRDAFQVEGRVTEVLPNGTVRAELKNGHRLLAFVVARDKKRFAGLKTGDEVGLQLTPFDLSAGRILLK